MLRLAHQNQKFDLQRLKQKEERKKIEQVLVFLELEEDNRRRPAEATLTELEIRDHVLIAEQSLQQALSELGAQSQNVKSVRLTTWVANASTQVPNHFTQVQDSTVGLETRGAQGGLPLNPTFASTAVPQGFNIIASSPFQLLQEGTQDL